MNRIIILGLVFTFIVSCHKNMPVNTPPISRLDSIVVDTTLYGIPTIDSPLSYETFSFYRPVYAADSIIMSSTVTVHYQDTTTRIDNIEPTYGIDNYVSLTQKTFNKQVVMRYHVFNVDLTFWHAGDPMYIVYLVGTTSPAPDTILFRITYYTYKN